VKPPTDCPCCGGDGKRHDGYMGTVDAKAKCPACSGSGKAPTGRGADPDAIARMVATRKARAASRPPVRNQHVPWTRGEDVFLQAANRGFLRTGKPHRPKGWWQRIADRMHGEFPDQPLRTVSALKQQLLRLSKNQQPEDTP